MLGENAGTWTYEMVFTTLPGDRTAALKRELTAYTDMLFPDGGPLDLSGNSSVVWPIRFAGHDGFRAHTGIEGYNDNVFMIDRGARGTLVIHCRTLGDVMGGHATPEPGQVDTCEKVIGSMSLQ